MRPLALAIAVALLPGAGRAVPAAVAQARKIEAGKSALERLRTDARRRRYRDGWEAVLRLFDGAVKAAPNGPRAAEAAAAAARARVELWEVSRSPADARAAIAALRKVDEDYPGPAGAQALAAAVALATRTHEAKDRAAVARRLAEKYPQEARAVGAAAAAPHAAAPHPAAVTEKAAGREKVAAVEKPAPAAGPQVPVESDDDDAPEADRQASSAIEEVVKAAKARASARAAAAASGAEAARSPEAPGAPAAGASSGDDDADDDAEQPPEEEAPANPPSRSTPIVRAVKSAVAALTEPDDEPASAAKAREIRSTALGAGTPLATQLGLKIRRVVVDAGHGGRDTGAIGPGGTREKDVALAIARKVAARLKGLGFQVVMTRNRDVYVPLDERTRIANESRADLFISIHCNAARKHSLRGVETWTLNVSSDRYATRLAAFENAEADRTVSDLRLILADLATKANAGDARDLAQSVQSSLVRTLRSRVGPVRDHGVKQALFYVLLGTHMPSILVETGFISNPAEEARLRSARFQGGIAEAVAHGMKEFVDSRLRIARAP
ncbi:MAG TPA: N-acetylmuramoyl-L-alanine amidase [Myxococcales bacterium]|nr:N-acetylmuramoyl-L-alanine amidase [Myxococcales bacterium]